MKAKKAAPRVTKLNLRTMRAIENELKVYLDKPRHPTRSACQQFAVYDEDEKYVGEVIAAKRYFTEEELKQKIVARFK
jgi:hypothetical protein